MSDGDDGSDSEEEEEEGISSPPSSHTGSDTSEDYQPSIGQGAPLINQQLVSDMDLEPDDERSHLKGLSYFASYFCPFNPPKKKIWPWVILTPGMDCLRQ